jgi:phosphatidylglycerol---prolipoprotein diacylglyceryl transferase
MAVPSCLSFRSQTGSSIGVPDALAPQRGVGYQPANVYELLVAAAIGAVIIAASRRRWPAGLLYLIYIGLYATTQFLVFFLRAQPVIGLGLRQAQWTSIAVIVVLVPIAFAWWRRMSRAASLSDTRPPQGVRV